jgi:hypothetical protein
MALPDARYLCASRARSASECVSLARPFGRDAMRRRTFIAALGSAAAWPVVARAQKSMPTVGVLLPYGSERDSRARANWLPF